MSRRKSRIKITEEKKLDEQTARKAGAFLFDLGIPPKEDEDQPWFSSAILSAKTRIKGPDTMNALSYYDVLAQGFRSEAAMIVGDTLKRLLIADKGLGREEAKDILKGSLPDEIEIPVGHE